MNLRSIAAIAILLTASGLTAWADVEESFDENSVASRAIIGKYLQAATQQTPASAVEVEINASVPRLNQQGKLRALRKISKLGIITYRVLGFQGDNTVKKEVIGRYLQAEQQSQSDPGMTLTPANYKFKLKCRRELTDHESVYVFQVSPQKRRVGLFKGEMWLDARSYLPVMEKGRLVKNPSIFFRKVDFERAFAIQNGVSVPAHMTSTIDTRLVGKVELNINYTAVDEASSDQFTNEIETVSVAETLLR